MTTTTARMTIPLLKKGTGRVVGGAFVPHVWEPVEWAVTLEIDTPKLMRALGGRAVHNKRQKAALLQGVIYATVKRVMT